MPITRRAARAILVDEQGRLVLIRRTKPGQLPYWTAPGGGVEQYDPSLEAAMHRELAEELGAKAAIVYQAFMYSVQESTGVSVQHFFLARLVELDEAARTGAEYTDAGRGGYILDRVEVGVLGELDLKPAALKEFVLANHEALAVDAAAYLDEKASWDHIGSCDSE